MWSVLSRQLPKTPQHQFFWVFMMVCNISLQWQICKGICIWHNTIPWNSYSLFRVVIWFSVLVHFLFGYNEICLLSNIQLVLHPGLFASILKWLGNWQYKTGDQFVSHCGCCFYLSGMQFWPLMKSNIVFFSHQLQVSLHRDHI